MVWWRLQAREVSLLSKEVRELHSRGGKAQRLGVAAAAGMAVPRFAVLPIGLESASPDMLAAWLGQQGLSLPVAIRSSADVEDGDHASYAGMFESRLGVASPVALSQAVAIVVRSAAAERVSVYSASQGIRDKPRVRVLVQEMVDASSAGVCLVRPADAPDSIRVEAVSGLGQLLVSGEAEPDVFVLGASDLAIRARSAGAQYLEMICDGTRRAIPASRRMRLKVTEAQVREIARLARRLDRHFRFAAGTDVEWAFDQRGALFTLQVRPLAFARSELFSH